MSAVPYREAGLPDLKTLYRPSSLRYAVLLGLAATALTVAAYAPGWIGAGSGSRLQMASMPRPAHAELTLQGAHAERRYGYAVVTGSVRNVSGHSLKNTEAVVELLDAKGVPVRVDSALLEMSNVPAGEVSPFTVQLDDEAAASSFRLRFRMLLGGALSAREE